MPKVTALNAQKNNKKRLNVYVDGEYSFPISVEVLARFPLKKGQEIDDKYIEEILNEDLYYKMLDKTLGFISYQARTKKEIEDRVFRYLYKSVKSKRHLEVVRERIMEKVDDLGLIDDAAYAKSYIQSKSDSKKPPGRYKIKEFLMKKGVNRDVIESEIANYPYELELAGAKLEAEKKMKSISTKGKNDFESRDKLWKYLSRKGYPPEIVRTVVDIKFKV